MEKKMIGEFEDKGIFKIKQNSEEAIMHYVFSNNRYYSLTLKSSEKCNNYINNKDIEIEFTKTKECKPSEINILEDRNITLDLFNRMTALNFCYFKEFTDDLVTIEIKTK